MMGIRNKLHAASKLEPIVNPYSSISVIYYGCRRHGLTRIDQMGECLNQLEILTLFKILVILRIISCINIFAVLNIPHSMLNFPNKWNCFQENISHLLTFNFNLNRNLMNNLFSVYRIDDSLYISSKIADYGALR